MYNNQWKRRCSVSTVPTNDNSQVFISCSFRYQNVFMFGHVMTCHLLTSSVHVVLSSHRQVVSRTDYGWPSTTTPYILTVDVVIYQVCATRVSSDPLSPINKMTKMPLFALAIAMPPRYHLRRKPHLRNALARAWQRPLVPPPQCCPGIGLESSAEGALDERISDLRLRISGSSHVSFTVISSWLFAQP